MYIRLNSLRIGRDEFLKRMETYGLSEIGWYESAFKTKCEKMGSTLEYQLGYFYIQSLSSMIPVIMLDPNPEDILLDVAAAPGSKATQAAMHMKNKGIIIANDLSYMRLKSLGSHIDRLGITNTAISNFNGCRFPRMLNFTKVLLDAPCSSIGSKKCTITHSANRIHSLSRLQKSLLVHAFDLLSLGGHLVYSTCTTTVDENENVIEHLLNKRHNAELEKITLPVEYERGICPSDHINKYVCRYELDESFFVAKITKSIRDVQS